MVDQGPREPQQPLALRHARGIGGPLGVDEHPQHVRQRARHLAHDGGRGRRAAPVDPSRVVARAVLPQAEELILSAGGPAGGGGGGFRGAW